MVGQLFEIAQQQNRLVIVFRRTLIDQLLEQKLIRDGSDIYHLTAGQLESLVVTPRDPKSDKAPAALLKKGYAYLAMNDRPRAIVQFQYVVHEYPNSRESALAKDRLRQLGIQ